jgi:hypothetical protein
MRPGFSISADTSRREAFEAEAMSSSGHRLVPPKKSVNGREADGQISSPEFQKLQLQASMKTNNKKSSKMSTQENVCMRKWQTQK